MPRVSFLVPTYNRAHFLGECIDSIISQEYKEKEIVIIDDCSTDNTEELIKERYSGKVIYKRNKENKGVAYSRNVALNYASGDYIGLLDSDDIIYDRKYINIALEILESHSGLGALTCDAYCIDRDSNRISDKSFFQTTIDHRGIELSSGVKDFDYIFMHGVHSCGAIIKRSVIDEVGFLNTRYKIAWDEDFFLRVVCKSKYKIYYHNVPLAGYRIHSNGLSNNASSLYQEKIACMHAVSNRGMKKYLGIKYNTRLASQYMCLSHAYAIEKKIPLAIMAGIRGSIIYPPMIIGLMRHGFDFLKGYRT